MPRLPHDYVSCVECGHVWNAAFNYDDIPYIQNSTRMFNRGLRWTDHLRGMRQAMLERLPEKPTVVEIGHGDADFLAALAKAPRVGGSSPTRTARRVQMASPSSYGSHSLTPASTCPSYARTSSSAGSSLNT